MRRRAILHRGVGLGLIVVGVLCASCFPAITNLSKGESVPEAVARHVPAESKLLILPLWYESDSLIFRNPYVIPASALGTSEADVPRRMSFYLDTWPCGGPDEFVLGYLVVAETGTVVWSSDDLHQDAVAEHNVLKQEISDLIFGRDAGPYLRELIRFRADKIEFDAPEDGRLAALRFLGEIPEPD